MTTLKIAPRFSLPLDLVTTASATFGIRGSGKTNTNVVMVEELLEHGQQVVIIDPTDVWWGLKSSKDGKKAGYPVIVLGGRMQDLPLGAGDGNTIADFVVDSGPSLVLSLRHFESDAEKRRFITDFARRIYHRKGQQADPSPVMIVVDEASLVVPQRVMGEDAKMVGAIQRWVRQGRSSGIGVNLIDARPATVNKDVLAGVEMLITHRITSPQDRKALTAWIEQHDTEGQAAAFLDSLASLEKGDAWFWSPGWLNVFEKVHVRERRTFDSSYTPKAGEQRIAPTKVAEIDLDEIRGKLGASIEKAKSEDPKELRKRITELEKQAAQAGTISGTRVREMLKEHEAEVVARERSTIAQQVRHAVREDRKRRAVGIRTLVAAARNAERDLAAQVNHLNNAVAVRDSARGALEAIQAGLEELEKEPDIPADSEIIGAAHVKPYQGAPIDLRRSRPMPPNATVLGRRTEYRASDENGVSGVEQRILDTLKGLEDLGITPADKDTVAALVGYHPNAKSYANALGASRTAGRITYPQGGTVALTDAGRAIATASLQVSSRDELHQVWYQKLGNIAQRILQPLVEAYPDARPAADIAQEAGYHPNAKSFANMKGRLRTLGLIDYPAPGMMAATKILFPEGLR